MRKPRRRARGEGSVYPRKDGRWVGALPIPGRPKKYVYGRTRSEASKKLTDLHSKILAGLPPPDDQITVAEWLDIWLESKEKLAPKTLVGYKQIVRSYLKPEIGKVKLTALNPARVEKMLDDLAARHPPVPPPTVKYTLDILRIAIKGAQRQDLILRTNPASLVTAPAYRRRRGSPFSPKEATDLLTSIKRDRLYALILLALTTGLRRGELLGLAWGGVDFTERVIWVRQGLQRQRGKGLVLKPTKTERSEAPVAMAGLTVEALQAHRGRVIEERLAAGVEWQGHDDPTIAEGPVFVSTLGTSLDPDNVWRRFKKMLVDAGVPDRRLHDSRHTTGSILTALHVDPTTVAKVLRHSKVTTSMNLYSHSNLSQQREAADTLDELLRGLLA